MNDRFKFRIYSFLDKTFHYFTLEEGYPQGIAGGVSEPQQFTGCHDSHNKEICEGDILTYKTGVNGQVLYEADQGAYIFQWKRNGPNQNYINLNCDVAFESVIVGNIFETPYLLK